MKRTLTLSAAAMLAVSTAAFLPTQAMAQVDVNIVIGTAPPPPRYEPVPTMRRGYVWAPGFWNWDGRVHVWNEGHWETERVGRQFQRAEWVHDQYGWRLNRGGWIDVLDNRAAQQPLYVREAPPPPRYEPVPHPRHGYVWTPGHWEWRGHRHDWVGGMWVAERPGYVYRAPAWRQREGGWSMDRNGWERNGWEHNGRARGDRDHDGIPDRYDRDRDNDGVPNRHDRDRDGDGVPNRHDARPDNPRRN
ncbi:MAG: YXWGXW repeat-containing protein [Pseudomonadota bacterium]